MPHDPAGNWRRLALAISMPLIALALQWLLWDYISPFVWFLFFPAVFFSARIGGLWGGMASTGISVLLVWYFFVPTQLSWRIENPSNIWSIGLFLFMGYLFSEFQDRLHKANRRTKLALEETREANQRINSLYEKTLELDELKTQFFSNVSHELRTPLTLINGILDRCLKDSSLGEQPRKNLEVARRNSRLLYRHISDLMDIAKLEANKMEILYVELDLAHLVRVVASLFEVVASSRSIAYEVETPERLVVQADASMIQRVALNVLSNAFKFTPELGEVRVCLRQEEGDAVLEIDDSGPGIPENMRETVFERFRQVEGHAARRHGGTGLGLAMVKEYTLLHGGRVLVEPSPRGGTRIIIGIPLKAPTGTPIQPQGETIDETVNSQLVEELRPEVRSEIAANPERESGPAPLILVVEDNPDMNQFIQEALRPQYRVLAARDGQEGLGKAEETRPDLVITDIMMPGMSGDQMVEQLRRRADLADTPIIVLTAKMDDELRVQLFRLGVQGYLNKPFTVEELVARVKHILEDRQRTAESLRASEEKFSTAFQRAPLMMSISSLDDGIYQEVNDTFCKVSGFSREEVLGRSSVEIGWLDSKDRLELVRELRSRGNVRDRELTLRAKDGRQVHCLFNGEIITSGGQQVLLTVALDITARKRVEEELRRNEKDLQESQKIAKLGSWRLDVQSNAVHWTEELYRMYGFDPQQPPPPYTEHMKLFTKASWELLSTSLTKTVETGVPYELELELVKPDGGRGWMWVRGEAIRDENGKTIELWGAAQDITERKHNEEALSESDRHLRSLFSNMINGYAYCQMLYNNGRPEDFVYLDVNKAFINLTGLTDVVGKKVSEVIPGIQREDRELIDIYGRVASTGVPEYFETHLKSLDMWFAVSVYSPYPEHFVAVFDVITDRKRAEQKLRESNERIAALFEATTDSVILLDPDCTILAINEHGADRRGMPPEQLIGKPLCDLLPQECGEFRRVKVKEVVDTSQRVSFEEERDGKHYLIRMFPVLNRQGQVIQIASFSRDITEAKRAEIEKAQLEAQLRQAQRMEAVGTLAGGIAHDFNNLLASIIGYSEMACDDAKIGKTNPRDIEQVLKAADRAKILVKQILTFSRKAETFFKPLDLNKEVAQAIDLLGKTIPRMINVQFEPGNDLWKISADPNQMEQILLNMGGNSADAIEGQGVIRIKTENRIVVDHTCLTCGEKISGPYVVLEIGDTGKGMDEKTIEHIFEPFYTTKDVGKGTGLGLSTVYGIVLGHGGHISCNSAVGKGAIFTIFLPALDAVTEVANMEPLSIDDSDLRGNGRILLVDDEEPLLALGSRQLMNAGYEVVTAKSGEAALTMFREKSFWLDLVILDLSMPGIGGYAALKELLAIDPRATVIIASGYAGSDQIKDALAFGAAGYVAKPFKKLELLSTVKKALDK